MRNWPPMKSLSAYIEIIKYDCVVCINLFFKQPAPYSRFFFISYVNVSSERCRIKKKKSFNFTNVRNSIKPPIVLLSVFFICYTVIVRFHEHCNIKRHRLYVYNVKRTLHPNLQFPPDQPKT